MLTKENIKLLMGNKTQKKTITTKEVKDIMSIAGLSQQTPKIVVTNNWSCVTNSTVVVKYLKEKYSVFSPSARYTHLFKRRLWDGRYSMISDDGGFGTGLLTEILSLLTGIGIKYELDDRRTYDTGHILNCNWEWTGGALRDVQEFSLEAMLGAHRGIVKLATGLGKSRLAYRFIFELQQRTLMIVPRSDLMYQSLKEMQECIKNINIELLGDGHKGSDGAEITIATSAMLVNIKKQLGEEYWLEWASQFNILIVDECHKAGSDGAPSATWQMVMDIPASYRIGLSATPFEKEDTLQGLYVRSAFGEVLKDVSAAEGVEKGYLVPCTVFFMKPHYSVDLLMGTSWHDNNEFEDTTERNYHEEHTRYIVENEERNDLLIQIMNSMIEEGHKILVVAQRIPHNDLLFEAAENIGVPSFQFHGQIPNRKEVMNEYKKTKGACIMVASSIANDGIDVRDITCIIVAHGGRSFFQVVQRIGRGLRIDPNSDKTQLTVIDMDDSELGVWFANHVKKRRKMYKEVINADIFDIR